MSSTTTTTSTATDQSIIDNQEAHDLVLKLEQAHTVSFNDFVALFEARLLAHRDWHCRPHDIAQITPVELESLFKTLGFYSRPLQIRLRSWFYDCAQEDSYDDDRSGVAFTDKDGNLVYSIIIGKHFFKNKQDVELKVMEWFDEVPLLRPKTREILTDQACHDITSGPFDNLDINSATFTITISGIPKDVASFTGVFPANVKLDVKWNH